MKRRIAVAACALSALLPPTGAFGQAVAQPGPEPNPVPSFQNRLQSIVRQAAAGQPSEAASQELTRFDLDFPGGTPEQLVEAIGKSLKKPLNAIVPSELNDVQIPPLKLRAVTVAELFEALGAASLKSIPYYTASSGYGGTPPTGRVMQMFSTAFTFKTTGRIRDDSIWYFSYPKPILPQEERTCRFWQLAPYLENYTIDDITTAVQTGYKMLGEPLPEINFHKDTKLLIAVGEGHRLNLIDEVLRQLANVPSAKKPATPAKTVDEVLKQLPPSATGAKAPEKSSRISEPSPTTPPTGTRAP